MQTIENDKDTCTLSFNDIDKWNKNEYESMTRDFLINYDYSYSWFLSSLSKINFSYSITAGSCDSASFNNSIYKNDIELENSKKRLLKFTINRYNVYSNRIIKKLTNFSKLEENWDSHGASKISWITITNAIDFFMKVIDNFPDSPIPFVVPVPDGRIHFEWQRLSNELHHLIPKDNSNCYIYRMISKKEGTLTHYYDSEIGLENMFKMFSIWYGFNKL